MADLISDRDIELLGKIKKLLIIHEDIIQECTCDFGDDLDCWYRLSDYEQRLQVLYFLVDGLIKMITHIEE